MKPSNAEPQLNLKHNLNSILNFFFFLVSTWSTIWKQQCVSEAVEYKKVSCRLFTNAFERSFFFVLVFACTTFCTERKSEMLFLAIFKQSSVIYYNLPKIFVIYINYSIYRQNLFINFVRTRVKFLSVSLFLLESYVLVFQMKWSRWNTHELFMCSK